jgi:hypothetical protein
LRSGPQDLPAATGLALMLTVFYLVQGLIADRILEGSGDNAPRSLLSIAFQFSIVALLLSWRGMAARITQTFSALAGTGFLLGLVWITLLAAMEPGQPRPGLALASLGLFAWSLVVDAHIYRHALSIKMSIGILVAVLIFAGNFVLLEATFG